MLGYYLVLGAAVAIFVGGMGYGIYKGWKDDRDD